MRVGFAARAFISTRCLHALASGRVPRALPAQLVPAKRVMDDRIQPLSALQALARVDFPSNLFSTEQLCWLRARLSTATSSETLAPVRILRQPVSRKGKRLDVLVNGKGKPFLDSASDARRLAGYIADFQSMVSRFEQDPNVEPKFGKETSR
jgi:hypothetical protein